MNLPTILVILAIASAKVVGKPIVLQSKAQIDRLLDVTVSAKSHKLQLVWKNLDINGRIILRTERDSDSTIILEHIVGTRDGWIDTDIVYNYTYFRDIVKSNTSCYGYYVDFYDSIVSSTSVLTSCMMAYPRWMETMRPVIGSKRFREIFLPGSHDTAAYQANFDPEKHENLKNKYVLTQDEDIRGQLMAGIRYLDIRPAYYNIGSVRFWVNHGVSRVQPMEQVLRDVYDFVKETNEIVIVDFHQFPVGFNSMETHRKLVKFVNDTIGDQIVTLQEGWKATLDEIWESGNERIILGYGDSSIVSEYFPFTWPAIIHRWADVDDVQQLKDYLYRVNEEGIYSMTPVSDMAQLTPTPNGVIFDKYKGLRKMADTSNPLVSEWYRYDLGMKANIVALEFIRGTTVIKDGMIWNANRTNV